MCFSIGDEIVVEQLNLLSELESYDLLHFQVIDVTDKTFSAIRVDVPSETIRIFDKRSRKCKIKFGLYYKAYANKDEYNEMLKNKNEINTFLNNIELSLSSMNHSQLKTVASFIDNLGL